MTTSFSCHGRRITFDLPDSTDLIQRKIGGSETFYEIALLEDMRARIEPGGLCVDAGAHLGNHTVFLAKVCDMRVLAFEPQRDMYRLLARHVELNGIQHLVRTFNVALGDRPGRGTMVRPLQDNTGSARLELDGDGGVEVTTLDEQVGDERVSLIKIDVEGHELDVLKGARRIIERDRPLIYAEAIDEAARRALHVHLGRLGYEEGEAFGSTPVVLFEHCEDEHQRLEAFTGRIDSALSSLDVNLRRQLREGDRSLRRAMTSIGTATSGLDRRVDRLERAVAELRQTDVASVVKSLERLVAHSETDAATLYEIWNLGMQAYEAARAGAGAARKSVPAYVPLNDLAARLRDWTPRRKRWRVPKGTDAGAFLQGYASSVAVRPGESVDFHLSTNRAPLFAKIRVFGFADRVQRDLVELHESPAVAVPNTGVWESEQSAPVDERGWTRVHTVRTGKGWLPGCYVARFETLDGSAFLHPFWVTSAAPSARMLRLCPTITHYVRNKWQAPAPTGRRRARPEPVRFPRPFAGSRGGELLRYELPLFFWAGANAVAMDCLTDMQVHAAPELLDAYEHVVIAGDCRFLTRELVDAFGAFTGRGGSITALGAAPGEQEVTLDVAHGTIARVSQTRPSRAAWSRDAAALWRATHAWTHKGAPVDLALTERGRATLVDAAADGALERIHGAVVGRLSGTDLSDDDSALVARATVGDCRCDATLDTTPAGGRVFVAGTNQWSALLDQPDVDAATARLLGVSTHDAARRPLVSVIMTAYNSAAYIARAIESVLAQSYDHLELIVVDDDSADDTFDVLVDFAARDRRVRPFKSLRNSGTYWSKNFGMTVARGDLITFQDSDDTSLPNRLREQVEALRWRPDAIASMVDYERRTEAGKLVSNRGKTQRRCFPSLMFRAAEVVERIGFFDSVRTSADQEFLHRLRRVYGADRVVEIRKPLYQALVREGSLTMSADAGVALDGDSATHLSSHRLRYVESFQDWHERIERDGVSPRIPFPLGERPFDAPAAMRLDGDMAPAPRPRDAVERDLAGFAGRTVPAAGGALLRFSTVPLPDAPDDWRRIVGVVRPGDGLRARRRTDYDVVMMSDFRFTGGTSHSNAAEITAQARAGMTTGLVQAPSPVLKRDRPINPIIQRLVDGGCATLVPAGKTVSCRVLVIRHPTVLERDVDALPDIRADEVVVVVNQAPSDEGSGRVFYDMARCQAHAKARYGSPGTWFPIGPLVRDTVASLPGAEHLSPDDWENIIDVDDWAAPRSGFVDDVPVIGRHSRDTPDKWPPDRDTILAAYPERGVKVRVLGGAAPVHAALGGVPDNWEVLAFGAMPPKDFLRTIDFLVYFHHPSLVEAFGRTILEALAAGVPAIVPHHFSALFEDVPIYAEPSQVAGIVDSLYADRDAYARRAAAGIDLVRRRFSYRAHVDRITRLAPDLADEGSEVIAAAAVAPTWVIDTAVLESDSVYKFGFELAGATEATRGRLRGVDRDTGREMFSIAVDGARTSVSEFVVSEHRVQVDVLVAVDAGDAFTVERMRVRRRADRPRQPALALGDNSVTAALATYPGRRDVVPAVIEALAPQVDKLFVYLNNYDEVPAFVRDTPYRDRIAFILDPASQLRAAAKFRWLDTVRGYHLVCDDDIIYPPDYAERMIAAIERHDRKAILGVHGVVFEPELVDARASRRAVFKFPEALERDTPVHFLGTGTVALHTSVLDAMDLSRLTAYPIANDEILAVSAKRAGVPMVCIGRDEGWLVPHQGVEFGIFEERQIDDAAHVDATELLASANPWPALPEPV